MYKNGFKGYLINNGYTTNVVNQYISAVNKISNDYSDIKNEYIDIYELDDLDELYSIQDQYDEADGWNIAFGASAATKRSGFSAYIKYFEKKNNINYTGEKNKKNYGENIILNVFISQIEELFSGYKILDLQDRRIDLLLENNNDLLAVKIIIGKADDSAIGPLLDFMGEEKYDEKVIIGIIITDQIDDSLLRAIKKLNNVKVWTYSLKVLINKN